MSKPAPAPIVRAPIAPKVVSPPKVTVPKVVAPPKAPHQGAPLDVPHVSTTKTSTKHPKVHHWDGDGADLVIGLIIALVLLVIVLASWAKMSSK